MIIGVCDDESIIREDINKRIELYKISNIHEIEVVIFASGEELLAYQMPIDILFLDIQMKGIDGLKTAEKIRDTDESMIIIFLTGMKAYMQEGYRVKAFRYLLKPLKGQEFVQALTDAIIDLTKNYKAIIGLEGDTFYIKLREIVYIERTNRCTIARTKRISYESTMSMSEWEQILCNGDFYRAHKSYIVNMGYIEEIGKDIMMENGEKVELAIRQVGRLKRACKEYRKRNAR